MKDPHKSLSYIAECSVMLELAKKGIYSQKISDLGFDFDLVLSNNLTVEVKASRIITDVDKRRKDYTRDVYIFNNYLQEYNKKAVRGRKRKCDFFIFVGLDKDLEVKDYFIVPEEQINDRWSIKIPLKPKREIQNSLSKYKDRWDLILEFPSYPSKMIFKKELNRLK